MNEEIELKQVGKRLRHLRKRAGFTSYYGFAYTHNFDRMTILRAEQGRNITLVTLQKILKIHKLTLKQFFKSIK